MQPYVNINQPRQCNYKIITAEKKPLYSLFNLDERTMICDMVSTLKYTLKTNQLNEKLINTYAERILSSGRLSDGIKIDANNALYMLYEIIALATNNDSQAHNQPWFKSEAIVNNQFDISITLIKAVNKNMCLGVTSIANFFNYNLKHNANSENYDLVELAMKFATIEGITRLSDLGQFATATGIKAPTDLYNFAADAGIKNPVDLGKFVAVAGINDSVKLGKFAAAAGIKDPADLYTFADAAKVRDLGQFIAAVGIKDLVTLVKFVASAAIKDIADLATFAKTAALTDGADLATFAKTAGITDFAELGQFVKAAGIKDLSDLSKFAEFAAIKDPADLSKFAKEILYYAKDLGCFAAIAAIKDQVDVLKFAETAGIKDFADLGRFVESVGITAPADLYKFAASAGIKNPGDLGKFVASAGITNPEDLGKFAALTEIKDLAAFGNFAETVGINNFTDLAIFMINASQELAGEGDFNLAKVLNNSKIVEYTNLTKFHLGNTNFDAINLSSTNLEGVNIKGANFGGAIFAENQKFKIAMPAAVVPMLMDRFFNHINNPNSGSVLTAIDSIDDKYVNLKTHLMIQVLEYLKDKDISLLMDPLKDILWNSTFDYSNSLLEVPDFANKFLAADIDTGNEGALELRMKNINFALKYLMKLPLEQQQEFMQNNNGFFIQLIHQANQAPEETTQTIATQLYTSYLKLPQVTKIAAGLNSIFCDEAKEKEFLILFGDEQGLIVHTDYIDKLLYRKPIPEDVNWGSLENMFWFKKEVAPSEDYNAHQDYNCNDVFATFRIFNENFKYDQQNMKFLQLLNLLNLKTEAKDYHTSFISATKGKTFSDKFVEFEDQENLVKIFKPHFDNSTANALGGPYLEAKELKLAKPHLDSILTAYEITNFAPEHQARLLLTLAGEFAKYSSSYIFGKEDISPLAVRQYAYGLLKAAYELDSNIITPQQYQEFEYKLLGGNGEFTCTGVLSDAIIGLCKKFDTYTKDLAGIIPPAWN